MDDHRLHGPAVDVETVGEITETRGAQRWEAAVDGEIDREIAAEQGKERDELAERNARGQAQKRQKRDPAVEDGGAAQLVEHHADREEGEEEAEAIEKIERVPLQRRQPDRQHQQQDAEPEQTQRAQRQHHHIHYELVAERPERAVDLESHGIVDEKRPRQLVGREVEERVADDIGEELRARVVFGKRQSRCERPQEESGNRDRDEEAGKDAQRAFGEIVERRDGALIALGDEKATDGEEDKDAAEAQNALPPAEPDERLVRVRAFRNQERMREDDG